ncbi:hypothetical protein JK628_18125 [Shewanella sp. KX20019]|uniref:hypothetical protein n=1 Tax=Shewanella sp. KX20019 TaxID=2803864 RepID=UPI0019277DC1|nr:hypothetical protein [Shewanella sp. KX20019]QQX79425.1 hypothetical protein JK628_18125 [Shewanella sp. KX20019]
MARKRLMLLILLFCTAFTLVNATAATPPAGSHNGQLIIQSGQVMAWEQSSQQWLTVEKFWQHWADSRGGLTWGSSETYPAYEQVKERDTFLIELKGGTCMMEFWHSRWRRANDVRRWDDAFNDYSACPHVFE